MNTTMNETFDTPRRESNFISPVQLTDNYLGDSDWRTKENSNITKSIGGLVLYQAGAIAASYWLDKIYPKDVSDAHRNADFHLHDLGFIANYCSGWDIGEIIERGLNGVKNKIQSKPPKHLSAAVQTLVNFLGILQNCFDKDTKVLLSDGSTKSFRELEQEGITEADVVVYDNMSKTFATDRAINIGKKSINSPLIEIQLEDGSFIRCEPWHNILTSNRGYVEAQELDENDDIVEFDYNA